MVRCVLIAKDLHFTVHSEIVQNKEIIILILFQVLLVGGDNFTLTGRPLVQKSLVDVQATIVEKTLAHTRTKFTFKARKGHRRIKFHRSAQTMFRINSITINRPVDMNVQEQDLLE